MNQLENKSFYKILEEFIDHREGDNMSNSDRQTMHSGRRFAKGKTLN